MCAVIYAATYEHALTLRRPFCFHAGYDPTNVHFQKAAEYFWNRYSMEEDSWRDQPLWCHTLERSHIKPIIFKSWLFREYKKRMGNKGHHYGAAQDNDAAAKSEAVPTARNSSKEASGDVHFQ
jgi:hypothetical protein